MTMPAPGCLCCSCYLLIMLQSFAAAVLTQSLFFAAVAAQPYMMSDDIEDLLDQLKNLASTVPHPPAAGEDLYLPGIFLPATYWASAHHL